MSKPMLKAIEDNDVAAARELVYQNVHNAGDLGLANQRSARHEAAARGRSEILAVLLHYDRTRPGPDQNGDTPLLLALEAGHIDCARLMLQIQPQLWGPDQAAVQRLIRGGNDQPELALELYRRGVPLRFGRQRDTGLEQADSAGLQGLCDLILARLQAQQSLMVAARSDDVDTLRRLLEDGSAAANDVDAQGWPALAHALEAGALRSIDALAGHQARTQETLPGGNTLLDVALKTGRLEVARRLVAHCNYSWRDPPAADRLRAAIDGPDDHPQAAAGLSPAVRGSANLLTTYLAAAAWRGKSAIASALLRQGARLPSLAPAVMWGDPQLLHALQAAGARANAAGRDGLPVLHLLAIGCGDASAVAESLLQMGVDLEQRHRHYGDAIEFAQTLERQDIVALLSSLGSLAAYTWQREARAAGIDRIIFFMSKAHGLILNPNDALQPLEVGGDYDGTYPAEAAQGLAELQRCGLWPRLAPAQRAIVEKLASGQDFPLSEILAAVSEQQVMYRKRRG